MAKKLVTLSGREFGTLTQAKAHFKAIRETTEVGSSLDDPERYDVLDIYRRYCSATGWKPVTAVDVVAEWDNRVRVSGTYAKTKALFIVDDTGEKHVFSIDKAITAVAT